MNVTVMTSKTWNGGEITRDMYAEMQQAMLQSAEDIATKARQLVPTGKGEPMHLRDTIRAAGRRKRSRLEVLAHGLASGDYETALPGAWVFAGDRSKHVYWAHWVEYGTYNNEGQPFLRPAADAGFNATLAHAERAGRRVINKRRRERAAARRAAG